MKDFVSLRTDLQSMYFMSTRCLKDKIDGVCVPQFKLAYIRETTHTLHKHLVKLCCEEYYVWWENQHLELQE